MEFHFIGPITLISQPNFITECGVHVSILTRCDKQIMISRIIFKVNTRETNIQNLFSLQTFKRIFPLFTIPIECLVYILDKIHNPQGLKVLTRLRPF